MPTSTWQVVNREVQRPLGIEEFLTTTDITTDDKVISTELGNRWNNADKFIGWYNIIRGTNNDEVTRRVEAYSGETGQLTLVGAALSGESGAQTCEVSRFHPDDVKRAYNRARQDVFPYIAILRDIDTIVTGQFGRQYRYTLPSSIRRVIRVELGQKLDAQTLAENLFTNGGFENWSSSTSPDDWTLVGSGASMNQEQETSSPRNYAVLTGANACRLVVPSTTLTTVLQTVTPSVATEGMECNVTAWVYCNTAARVSVRIAGNDGTAHGGTGWERISHVQNLAATATDVAAGIAASSGAAIPVFIDQMIITLGPSEPIGLNPEIITDWEHYAPAAGASNGGILEFNRPLGEKRRLRIIGMDALSSVSADSDTIEVDLDLLEPLYCKVREYLLQERRPSGVTQADDPVWRPGYWRDRYQGLLNQGHRLHVRPRLKIPA